MINRRPLIIIPSRKTAEASALRYRGEVSAAALISAVYAAGGEPICIHPHAPAGKIATAEVADRIAFADGILLPGGGDLSPRFTGDDWHETHYDVDEEQDAFDLALVRIGMAQKIPMLAICRGMQAVSIVLGGTLKTDMGSCHHRYKRHDVTVTSGLLQRIVGQQVSVSCYHHQCIAQPAPGLHVVAMADDGTAEAVELTQSDNWFLGLQWHPEDTWQDDAAQLAIFRQFVAATMNKSS